MGSTLEAPMGGAAGEEEAALAPGEEFAVYTRPASGRASRGEATYRVYVEVRLGRREIAVLRGLHYGTIRCIDRAKEKDLHESGVGGRARKY